MKWQRLKFRIFAHKSHQFWEWNYFCGVLYVGSVSLCIISRIELQNLKFRKFYRNFYPVPGAGCGILKVHISKEPGKVTKSRQHLTYRTSEISVHKIPPNSLRLAYLSLSAADEGLYFWCSIRRRWCCCGRPGCTSSLLIIVFCWRCPPPGQLSASSQHLPTHARAPHRVAIATGDEGPPYCLIRRCSKKSPKINLIR